MAYSGTTSGSSLQNVPKLASQGALVAQSNTTDISTGTTRPIGAQGARIWTYLSTDPATTVLASGYFTDAYKLGIAPGDLMALITHGTAGSTVTFTFAAVTAISSTGGGTKLSTATGCLLSTTTA